MLSCKEAAKRISETMDIRVTGWKRFGLKVHLFLCRLCSRYERQLNFLRNTLQFYRKKIDDAESGIPGLSESAKNEIKNNLKNAE